MAEWRGFVRKLLRKRYARRLGLSLTGDGVNMAEIGIDGAELCLRRYRVVNVPDCESGLATGRLDELTGAIKEAFKAGGFTATAVCVTVNGEFAHYRELSLPPLTKRELRRAVPWEMQRYVAAEAAGYCFDYEIIDRTDEGVRVFAAALPRRYIDICEGIADCLTIDLTALEIAEISLARAVGEVQADSALVWLAGDKRIMVYRHGRPIMTKSAADGDALPAELKRTLQFCNLQQPGPPVDRVFVGGGSVAAAETAVKILLDSGCPAELLPSPAGWKISAAADEPGGKTDWRSVADAAGAALRGGELCTQ